MTSVPVAPPSATTQSWSVRQQKPRSLAANVRRGAMWTMSGTILLRVSSIAVTAIVARILSPHDFGVFSVANTVFTIVVAFGEFGVGSCLARADLKVSDLAPTLWSVSLGSSVAVAATLVLFARPIAAGLGAPDGAAPVRLMAVIMILTGVAAVPTSQCIRDFKQHKIFLANVVSFVPSTIVLLAVAKTGGGPMAFAWSRVAGQLTSATVILISAGRLYPPGLTRYALSVLFKFGFPLAVANFVGYLLQNVDYALIGHLMGPIPLGTYVIAFNAASWPASLLVGALSMVAMPAFSRVKHDRERLMGAVADGVRAVLLLAAPMSALVAVLAKPIILTLYGTRWVAAANVLVILSLYGLISIVCLLFSNMLAAVGKSTFILLVQLLWLVALVPAMTIGVRAHGITGAATAHLLVIVPIVLPSYLVALKRATGVRIHLLVRAALPVTIAAVLAGMAAWAVISVLHRPLVQLIAGGAAGGLLYAVLTAPQILSVLGRSKSQHPAVRRAMRFYYRVGRSLGFQVGPLPRHARRGRLK